MLAIDIGNSRIKWALFESAEVLEHNAFAYDLSSLDELMDVAGLAQKSSEIFISSVAGDEINKKVSKALLSKKGNTVEFTHTMEKELGVINSYSEPEKMGIDRWLGMLSAYNSVNRSEESAVCVISCGTAITVDLIGFEGQHLGGLIMPGFRLMQQSLISGTSNINERTVDGQMFLPEMKLACSTRESVEQGSLHMVINGLKGTIARLCGEVSEDFHCVITGGDGQWVSERLGIECVYEPFLVLHGLNLVFNNK